MPDPGTMEVIRAAVAGAVSWNALQPLAKGFMDKASEAVGGKAFDAVKTFFMQKLCEDAACQLEAVTVENREAVQEALMQGVEPFSEAELSQLRAKIKTLWEETEKFSRQMQKNQVQVTQTHTGTGDNANIQASGGGDALGRDKIGGSKFIGGTHYHGSHPESRKERHGKGYQLPAKNPFFTGREEDLTAIVAGFEKESATAAICQASAGLGGIGKTALAVEYACRYADHYDLMAFLDAGTPTVLETSLLGLSEYLENLNHLPKVEDAKVRQEILKNWLSQRSRWLLIMDNADGPDALRAVQEFIPNSSSTGHVLITTRMAKPIGIIAENIHNLGVFRPDEAVAFLQAKIGPDDPDDAQWRQTAEALAEDLGYLPLALEQAAALIVQSKMSLDGYLEEYQREKLTLLAEGAAYAALNKPEQKQVAVTWNMNLKAVVEKKPILKELLNLSAFMAPETIPFAWITQGLAETESDSFGNYKTTDQVKRLFAPLHDYSLVQLEREQGYQVHRLVQEVIKHPLPLEEQAAYHLRCMRALTRTVPEENNYIWDKGLYAQGLFLTKGGWNEDSETMALLCSHTGSYEHLVLGALKTAESLYEKAQRIHETLFGEAHPDTATSYNNLAWLYQDQGRYAEAEPLYQKSLAIREKILGADHPDTASSYNNLAELYKVQGQYAEAEPLLKSALSISEKVLGVDHPDTATSYNNLAGLYLSQGKYAEAEPLLKNALSIYEKVLGADHPATATGYNNLAELYKVQGQYAEAEPLYQKSLAICENMLGESHSYSETNYRNLALLYYDQGRYAEAEPLLLKAMKICESLFGEAHPDTATSYNNLALLYQAQDRYAEAEPLYEKAQRIYETLFGEAHPNTATSYNNLALLHQAQGRYAEAELLFEKTLKIRKAVLGEDHPDTAWIYGNMGGLYQAQGRYDEVEPLYEKALKILEALFGEAHPDIAQIHGNLAGLYWLQKRYKEALPLAEKALVGFFKALGPKHHHTQDTRKNLTALYQAMRLSKTAIDKKLQALYRTNRPSQNGANAAWK